MKVFISGPMGGYPDENFPLFDEVAEYLRRGGHNPVNPAQIVREELGNRRDLSRHVYMRHLIPKMSDCKAICLLPKHNDSWGSNCEKATALMHGMDFYEWDPQWRWMKDMRAPERVTVFHPSMFARRMP